MSYFGENLDNPNDLSITAIQDTENTPRDSMMANKGKLLNPDFSPMKSSATKKLLTIQTLKNHISVGKMTSEKLKKLVNVKNTKSE